MFKISIENPSPADAEAIAYLNVNTWKNTYIDLLPRGFVEGKKVTEKNINAWYHTVTNQNKENIVFIARAENSDILGFVWGGKARDNIQNIPVELYAIYVSPEYQRKGIGTALFTHFFDYIQELGFKRMYLWVLHNNPSTIFYEKMRGIKTQHTKEYMNTYEENFIFSVRELHDESSHI
jgi:ribosomal protein S18 acetylase RimI-like enzyme